MGKKRFVAIIFCTIFAVAAFACGITLSACQESGSKKLETPINLQIADEYLTWNEVAGAEGYIVDVNGEEYETDTNSLDVMEITTKPQTYTFRVFALGEYVNQDSDYSDGIEYEVKYSEYLEYRLINDGSAYEVKSLPQSPKLHPDKIIIPEYHEDGKPITRVAENAFRACPTIKAVYVPDSIEEIGQAAFASCENMTRIRLSGLVSVVPDNTFNSCTALKGIEIPSSVTEIGKQAFANCQALKYITFNEGLKTINSSAFADCKSLKALNFPSSIEQINPLNAYTIIYGCDNLESLTVSEGKNATFRSDNNCIIVNGSEVLLGCKTSVIPDYVTKIGQNSFSLCDELKEITIPGSVKTIGQGAFGQSGLRQIVLEEGVSSIDKSAFLKCDELKALNIPSTVTKIGIELTYGCNKLKKLTVAEANTVFKSDGNCIISKSDNKLISGCAESIIPDYVTAIGNYAFGSISSLTGINLPYGITEIGARAFLGCSGLTSITLPDSVIKIGESAFSNCTGLRSVFIPGSVKEIGVAAFKNCYYASVAIPAGVTTIKINAFAACAKFTPYDSSEEPEGWINKIYNDYNSTLWFGDNKMLYKSELRYDNNYAYTYSIKTTSWMTFDKLIITPYRRGYTFMGWATGENSSEATYGVEKATLNYTTEDLKVIKVENVMISRIPKDLQENTVLYAVWQRND